MSANYDFDSVSDALRDELKEVAETYFADVQHHDYTSEAETNIDDLSVSAEDVSFEHSVHDVKEKTTVEQFMSKGCGCKFGHKNSNCSSCFSVEEIVEQRQICLELTDEQLDLVILSQLKTLHNRNKKDNERQRIAYMFENRQVCQDMYMLLYCVGRTRLKNLKDHYFSSGLAPRVHKLKGQLPVNTISQPVIQDVTKFLENYAEDNAVYLPGRFPTHKREDVQLLPSSTTKKKVWELYKASALQDKCTYVGLTTFRNIWNKICPHIVAMKPMNDLCSECQSNTATISKSANFNLHQKLAVIHTQAEHLRHADSERDTLRKAKKESEEVFKQQFPDGIDDFEGRPCSFTGVMHYSYDYAQQVHFPSNPLQPGPIYFKTPRKCGIFGVHCEAIPRQINYLVDESVDTGKGANSTISYVHHFLETYGLGETDVHFHADNCSGQNKNNCFLWYYAWRVITGLHNSVLYSFLIAGHTKFSPDWCFGLFKQRFRRTFVSSLFEIADVFDDSSSIGVNIAELCGLHSGKVLVPTYDWVTYLSQYFKKMKGIKKFHHFRFTREKPGVVFCKEYIESAEMEFSLLKKSKVFPKRNVLPNKVTPSGLSAERRKYLADEIRQFCKEETKDLVAPNYGN